MSTEVSLFDLQQKFPTEEAAETWLVSLLHPNGLRCPACESDNVQHRRTRIPQPYRCADCFKDFSVRTGTLMHGSKLPLRKWVFALYLMARPKGIPSTQLARDLGVTQKTAWYLGHRIRRACKHKTRLLFGQVEIDEAYIGGIEKNKHAKKKQKQGGGHKGKVPVVGMLERETKRIRAFVMPNVTKGNMHQAIEERIAPSTIIYTDELKIYTKLKNHFHEQVQHGKGQYVNGDVHTNSLESFWALLKRSYKGVHHYMSPKHLDWYVLEAVARHNWRSSGPLGFLTNLAGNLRHPPLTYQELIA